ncbi:hypothetical protein L1987_14709 [Smallanthus sonchifolius]|uniref:Uncharacterized protein n=2 Tax=Smallanthus sonchifolius TaxID=185202 RepID=A0ACB9J3F8_9ASTR|nr:hypothetical protein L1987_14701 [Smallanthus sonchifolius]KAI3815055.1 hypothetical protein L1987_14709 [Smallanthus sonchifolius]
MFLCYNTWAEYDNKHLVLSTFEKKKLEDDLHAATEAFVELKLSSSASEKTIEELRAQLSVLEGSLNHSMKRQEEMEAKLADSDAPLA